MPTLYGHPFSRAHRVMWMLQELGLAFDHVPTDFLKGGTRDPAFLAINPNGRVPAYEDEDGRFCESLSINLYLAKKHGGPLAPHGLIEDALATQWSLWVAAEIEKPLLFTCANLQLFAEDLRRPDELAIGYKRLDRPWTVLEAHLADRAFLLGDRFTVADLNVASVMALGVSCGVPMQAYPRMKAWLTTCLERPAAADWKPIRFSVPRPPTPQGMLAMFM